MGPLFVVMHIRMLMLVGPLSRTLSVDMLMSLKMVESWTFWRKSFDSSVLDLRSKALQRDTPATIFRKQNTLYLPQLGPRLTRTILTQVAPEAVISEIWTSLGKYGQVRLKQSNRKVGVLVATCTWILCACERLERTSSPKHHSERREVARRLLEP